MRQRLRTLIAQAPPPPAEEEVGVTLQESEIARLGALGYVGSMTARADDGLTELDRFEPQGGNPKDFAPLFERRARAAGAMRDGEYGKAEPLLRELVAALPDVPLLRTDLAEALYKQGRLDQADAAFQQVIAMAPDDYRARKAYGNFLVFGVQRCDEAVEQFTVALKQVPDDVYSLHDAAVALTVLGRFGEAEGHLQRALQIEPRTPRLWQAMGVLRVKQTRLGEAVRYFRRTLELDPECREAQAALQWLRRHTRP